MSLESLFRSIEDVITIYEEETGVPASRTRQMIERHGHIEALSKLAVSANLQQGFKVLRDRNRLDMTFEALIVRHAKDFPDDVVEAAKWRLENAQQLG